eukprot:gnl/MRDRNA2_/MRDRNA2_120921_c0_seq1.p1 gnl/MRDRNA2_/MRDRNA2_120921_c0~~gnl/MRDRNA2_/MRDRNA2_120921_c0_seq1.p1  ORF type:complete len:252 (+),score=67.49 gnl/MRDRNA2_/MRDRNA2_120921_c0_seq1:122-877(+)
MLDALFDGSSDSMIMLGMLGIFILMMAASLCWMLKHSKNAKAPQESNSADDVEVGEKSKIDGEDPMISSSKPAEGSELKNQDEPIAESNDPPQVVEQECKASFSTAADSGDAQQTVQQEKNIADSSEPAQQSTDQGCDTTELSQEAQQVAAPEAQKGEVDDFTDTGVTVVVPSPGVNDIDMPQTESEEVPKKGSEAANASVTEPDKVAVPPSNPGFCAKCCVSDSEMTGVNVIPPAEGAVAPLSKGNVGKK